MVPVYQPPNEVFYGRAISPEAQTAGKPTAPEPSRTRPASRKHMGVATATPRNLPPVNNPNAPQRDRNVRVPVRKDHVWQWRVRADRRRRATSRRLHSSSSPTLQVRANEGGSNISPGRNYISQPKKGHTIFTSRQESAASPRQDPARDSRCRNGGARAVLVFCPALIALCPFDPRPFDARPFDARPFDLRLLVTCLLVPRPFDPRPPTSCTFISRPFSPHPFDPANPPTESP